jgi:hypothetical protein
VVSFGTARRFIWKKNMSGYIKIFNIFFIIRHKSGYEVSDLPLLWLGYAPYIPLMMNCVMYKQVCVRERGRERETEREKQVIFI